MNKVEIIGRITRDPEVKQTPSNILVCSLTLAVDRRFKDQSGNKQTDFIPCVAWRQVADLIGKYCHKGSKIGVTGSIQTRSYEDNNGQRRNVVEVLIDELEFLDTKQAQPQEEEEIRPIPPMPKVEPLESAEETGDQLPFDIYGME